MISSLLTRPRNSSGGLFALFMLLTVFTMFLLPFPQAQAQTGEEPDNYVQVRVVPEKTHIEPGETILVAFEQIIYEDWHTYWKNPGDSGSATTLHWDLPAGYETGDIMWPVPSRIAYGPLMNYGYSDEAVLLQPLSAPLDMPEGPVTLSVDYEILVCHEICIPETGTLELELNKGEASSNEAYINKHHLKLPYKLKWPAQYKVENNELVLNVEIQKPGLVSMGDEGTKFEIFPEQWGYVDNPAEQKISLSPPREMEIRLARGERDIETDKPVEFLLAYSAEDKPSRAVAISAMPDQDWLASSGATSQTDLAVTQESGPGANAIASITVWEAILYALLGGLILNLMPCVFPILSMKALHFSEAVHAGDSHTKIHGLAYTAGILLCFGALAGTLIALQAAGAQIGWGFQLQNPIIILGLVFLFYLVGLSLSGFFEIQTKLSNVGGSLTSRKGPSGSFFTGILATIVATPCTAPFMGVAIGFALTQPAIVSMAVFLSLGLGLALPFLILSFVPSLHKTFPKPGPWMETFKEFLAFPIYLSVVWLVWVFVQQTGTLGVIYALSGIVGISFGVCLLNKGVHKFIAIGVILLAIILPFTCGCFMHKPAPDAVKMQAQSAAQPFSSALLQENLSKGDQPVFVYMTAAWCITCKFNERVALETQAVQSVISERNIAYIKGDWTNYDPEITEYLDSYGRSGVPLYVYYGAADSDTGERPEPVVLPQILTPGIVVEALSK